MSFTPNIIHANKLNFQYLPAYALFIKEQKLHEYVVELLRVSRDIDVPLLRFFKDMPEDELIELSKITSSEFLTHLANNTALEQIKESIKKWVSDQLPQVGRYNISPQDIALLSYVRKQGLLHLLPQYASDTQHMLLLIKEIDQFIVGSDTASFQTYIDLLNERINQNLHFIEKIAETSPGVIYVYDIIKHEVIYSKGKTKELLGYMHEDVQQMKDSVLEKIIHPDDIESTLKHLAEFKTAKDEEIHSFEHRLRSRDGEYKWVRNYETVFKRDDKGDATQIIGISLDVGKEKKMAEALLLREEQLLEAQEFAEMGSFIWHLDKDQHEVTPQLNKILEIADKSDLANFIDKVHEDDQASVKTIIDAAIADGGPYEVEFRFKGKEAKKVVWSRGYVTLQNGKATTVKGTTMDVTERYNIINKLKRSDTLFKQAQVLTHLGNWTWEINKSKITWSDEMYRIFGLEPQSEEITFGSLLSYLQPKDKNIFLNTVAGLQKAEKQGEFLARIQLKNGSVKLLDIRAEVEYDNQGVAVKISGTCQDVTDQKLNERKLRENQNFLKKIADATPSIIAAYNVDTGNYLFINKAIEKLLGYSTKDVFTEGAAFFMNKIHPDDLPTVMEKNSRALELANSPEEQAERNEMVVEFKYRMQHINGKYKWFHTYGTIFDRNEQQKVEHVLNISHDITEQVETEQLLQEQEKFIQHIAEASPNILFVFDKVTDSIVYVNKQITTVLGYEPFEILEMESSVRSQLFHPEDQDKLGEQTGIKEEGIIQYECRMKEKVDGWRCLLVREIPFQTNEQGETTRLLCAALDISDRKVIEHELKQKTFELEQSNANLEEFAYVASHDLKEPLRKISSFGDRLLNREKDRLENESKIFLDKIIDSSVRMQQMIEDLLSISMITGNKTFENYSLRKIVDEVLQTLEYKIEQKNVTVTVDNLPEIKIIPSQFRQLFQNLLSNSIKFSRANISPQINITHSYVKADELKNVTLNNAKKYLKLTFKDNGIGFDERYSEKIFSIFQRLHGKSEYEGTGIGLAICKKIVENHSGKIFATAVENEGAQFTVVLPA